MLDVLFICKQRFLSGGEIVPYGLSSGLFNSANFVAEMLNNNGVTAKVVDVVDGNSIDRELFINKPKYAIIEAIWVTKDKIDELIRLHPGTRFIVRVHSEIPFLAVEGTSIEWLFKYFEHNFIEVAFNSKETAKDFERVGVDKDKISYLPNYYPVSLNRRSREFEGNIVNVGCFGAIRQLKNQLLQAFAAIAFADKNNYRLNFHINTERIESGGNPVLKNLRSLFLANPRHKLIEHPWLKHDEFIDLVKTMDIGLQVSFTETFNIVAADFVNCNIPFIGSSEIPFLSPLFTVKTTDAKELAKKMEIVLRVRHFNPHYLNKALLIKEAEKSENIWLERFK